MRVPAQTSLLEERGAQQRTRLEKTVRSWCKSVAHGWYRVRGFCRAAAYLHHCACSDFARPSIQRTSIPERRDAMQFVPSVWNQYADVQVSGMPQRNCTRPLDQAWISRATRDEQSQRPGLRALPPRTQWRGFYPGALGTGIEAIRS